VLLLQFSDPCQPLGPARGPHARQQHLQHLPYVAVEPDMSRPDLVQFAPVDVDMDHLRVRTELGDFAGSPIVEANPRRDQQIAFLQDQIGIAGRVHP
jgi:hypothetical protein